MFVSLFAMNCILYTQFSFQSIVFYIVSLLIQFGGQTSFHLVEKTDNSSVLSGVKQQTM